MTGADNLSRRTPPQHERLAVIDLGNVIPFVPRLRDDALRSSTIETTERPAPDFLATPRWSAWWTSLFVGSLLAHAALLAFLIHWHNPAPAVGLEAIAVDVVVFGAEKPAGVADTQSNQETLPETAPEQEEEVKATQVPAETVESVPAIPPPEVKAEPEKTTPENERKTEKIVQPSSAASGVGRGQSQSNASYFGRVAAHLRRYQRAEEAQGLRREATAEVHFTLDPNGRVVLVRLVTSSGIAAIDRAAQIWVKRASPFPAPPPGIKTEFTVPLVFRPH